MSKVKHVMVANGTTVCGRVIDANGTGDDCKMCARRMDARDRRAGVIAEVVRDDLVRATRSAMANPPAWLTAQPEIAMDGRPVVEHDDNGKITSAVIAVDGILAMFRVVIGATLVDRHGQSYLVDDVTSEHVWYTATDGPDVWTHADLLNMLDSGELSPGEPITSDEGDSFTPDGRTLAEVIADGDMMPSGDGLACICDDVMEGTHPTPIGVEVTCPVDGSVFTRTAGTPTTPLKPITFDDVKEANGWMSTDVDAVTRTLPAGTEVKPGFWNCCQAKPAVAVQFTSEDSGEDVYYQGCRPCASTVPAECLAKLPFCDDGKCDSCDDCRKVAAVVESNLSVSQEAMAEAEREERMLANQRARIAAEQSECNGDDGYREPAVIVLTGEQITALRESALLIAYKTAARHDGQMQLTRAFKATVRKFNTQYGHSCRTWADVRAVLIAAGVKGVKP